MEPESSIRKRVSKVERKEKSVSPVEEEVDGVGRELGWGIGNGCVSGGMAL